MKDENRLIDLSKKTVIQITALLATFMIVSIVLTYIIPGGEFGTLPDGSPDYTVYIRRDDFSGVPILKGIFALYSYSSRRTEWRSWPCPYSLSSLPVPSRKWPTSEASTPLSVR